MGARTMTIEPRWVHVICDQHTHEPATLTNDDLEQIEDCLGSEIILDMWLMPGPMPVEGMPERRHVE